MVRRRWPDILVIAGIVALGALGVWALWGGDLADYLDPPAKEVEEAPHGGGLT